MSNKRPYEEIDRQFNDLPLPDAEASWQKMKEKLDEDDDDIVPPPVFFRSCLGWGLFLSLLIVAWLIFQPHTWLSVQSEPQKTSPVQRANGQKRITPDLTTQSVDTTHQQKNSSSITIQKQELKRPAGETTPVRLSIDRPSAHSDLQKENRLRKLHPQSQPEHKVQPVQAMDNEVRPVRSAQPREQERLIQEKARVVTSVPILTDSGTVAVPPDSSVQKAAADSITKKVQPPKKRYVLSAGIGVQQQIPIAGQTAVPYGHYGRRGSLSDYIPSVYLKWENKRQWFIQGEFRYGGAQSLREFSFARNTKFDSISMNVTTTTQRLKKTYYHQLPITFNYYVRPDLSVGAGGMYSRFYRAVTEEETRVLNAQTGIQTVFKQIIPIRGFTDSFLYKTQLHVLLQADYQWRRFSFGLRYTGDLQPFIKFTRPDGSVSQEKSQTLQLMIRYRLWQSRGS